MTTEKPYSLSPRLNSAQVLEILGFSLSTLNQRIKAGLIPKGKKDAGGRINYWSQEEILKYKNGQNTNS